MTTRGTSYSHGVATDHEHLSDLLGTVFAYGTALIMIVGGLWIIYTTRLEPGAKDMQLLMSGLIGSAATWVFQRVTSSQTSRQTERNYANATDGRTA